MVLETIIYLVQGIQDRQSCRADCRHANTCKSSDTARRRAEKLATTPG